MEIDIKKSLKSSEEKTAGLNFHIIYLYVQKKYDLFIKVKNEVV